MCSSDLDRRGRRAGGHRTVPAACAPARRPDDAPAAGRGPHRPSPRGRRLPHGALLDRRGRARPIAAIAYGIALGILLYASTLPNAIVALVPALQHPLLLTIHVGLAMLSYGIFAFAFAAAVNVSDPDPVRWIVIYLAASGVAAHAALRGRMSPVPAFVVGLVALAWAIGIGTGIHQIGVFGRMFETWQMKDATVEVARETGGLLVVIPLGWSSWTTVPACGDYAG